VAPPLWSDTRLERMLTDEGVTSSSSSWQSTRTSSAGASRIEWTTQRSAGRSRPAILPSASSGTTTAWRSRRCCGKPAPTLPRGNLIPANRNWLRNWRRRDRHGRNGRTEPSVSGSRTGPRRPQGRLAGPSRATACSPTPVGLTTTLAPPACARSMASLQSASACLFWARGTCVALQRENRESNALASAWSGISLASFTRQRPCSCLDDHLESSSMSTACAPSSWASASARSTALYSATLLVWTPRYSEIDAIGGGVGAA